MSTALAEAAPVTSQANEMVTIPAVTLPGGLFVPSFLASKYALSQSDDGIAISVADRKPWTRISYLEQLEALKQAELEPLTLSRRLSIAYQITQVDENWTGGKVGEGEVFRGLHLWTVDGPQDGTFESPRTIERRWHVLPNGERIFDVSGNVFHSVFDDIHGDEQGIIAKPFGEDSPLKTTPPYPTDTHGMGSSWVGENWSGLVLRCGGCWVSGDFAGVFFVCDDSPSYRYDDVGFRGTKSL